LKYFFHIYPDGSDLFNENNQHDDDYYYYYYYSDHDH